jgi:hypothetical protein
MFRRAGVLQDATMDVVARAHDTEDDPFLESDAAMEHLLQQQELWHFKCNIG